MQCHLFLICLLNVIFIYCHHEIKAVPVPDDQNALQKYTTKYDNIDVDGILHNRRLLQNYVNCLLEKSPCTNEGKVLKTYLPDALATECAKCSDVQKVQAGKIFTYILQYHRDYWNALTDKYDPEGNFRKKYEFDSDGDDEDD